MQMTNNTTPPSSAVRAARQEIYRLLSLCTCDPRADRWPALVDPKLQKAMQIGTRVLAQVDDSPTGSLAPGELGLDYLDPSALLSL